MIDRRCFLWRANGSAYPGQFWVEAGATEYPTDFTVHTPTETIYFRQDPHCANMYRSAR